MISKIGNSTSGTPTVSPASELSDAKPKEHKIKELKVLKSKLKPLYDEYRNSLEKLKEKMVSKPKITNASKRKLTINEKPAKKLHLE